MPPSPLGELTAVYPPGARATGVVVVELVVTREGATRDARVVEGPAELHQAALDAARGWQFRPAARDGKPMPARIRIGVQFQSPELLENEGTEGHPTQGSKGPPSGSSLPAPARPASAPPTPSRGSSNGVHLPTPSESGGSVPGGAPGPPPAPIEIDVRGQRSAPAQSLSRTEVRMLPGAFGDPFRAIEALPGVTPIASGLPFFFVRGAPPGNLGYFFGNVAVPALFHAAVGPSVIHPALVEEVTLYPGAAPARYGQFAGGIVAGTPRPAGFEPQAELSLRLVDSGAMVEVPFPEQRGSALFAGRYSYTAALFSLLQPDVELGYWDYQSRVRYELDGSDSVTLLAFGAHDFLAAEESGERQTLYDVTFHRADVAYQHRTLSGAGVELGVTLGSDVTGAGFGDRLALRSRRIVPRVMGDLEWLGHRVHWGASVEWASFDVLIEEDPDDDDDEEDDPQELLDRERPFAALPVEELSQRSLTRDSFEDVFGSRNDRIVGSFVDIQLRLSNRVQMTPGLRLDWYQSGGASVLAFEPRLFTSVRLTEQLSLLHSIGLAHQAPSFAVPVPGFRGNVSEGLQRSLLSSAGVSYQLGAHLQVSVTGFNNALFRGSDPVGLSQLDSADRSVDNVTDRVLGHNYGAELYLRRRFAGGWTGFLAYTLSRSTRAVNRLEGPSSVDRRYVINAALSVSLGAGYSLGGRLVTYSGVPAEVHPLEASDRPPRGPWFLRVDTRFEKRWPRSPLGDLSLVFEVQNASYQQEVLDVSCYAYGCEREAIGPVTIPSLGLEARL